jgi:FtsP/CotA-like multicopper oxidase with cupredoxin domain
MFTRRNFLAGALTSVIAPRLVLAQDVDGIQVLVAEKAEMQLVASGDKTGVWRFQKEQPIAVLRAKQGQPFKFRLQNLIGEELSLHWFGVRGPSSAMTVFASPQDVAPVDIEFTPPDAGTFWFGPLTNASKQRDMGLYGMLIVEEVAPLDFIDVPLIFDDWKVDDAGKMAGGFNALQDAIGEGRMGNWFTLNGAFKSHLKVERKKPLRFRVLNVANVRTMNILFKGADLYIGALDGQPVPLKSLGQEALKLEPGQRADLFLADAKDQIVVALDLFDDVAELGFIEPTGETLAHELPDNFALPPNPISVLGDLAQAKQVTIIIAGGAKGGLKSAKVGDQELETRALLEKGLAWAFNGIAGPGGPSLFDAMKGETVVLTLDNTTSFPQALHIHGHVWQLVEQDGQALEGQPWRDTAVVPGLSKVKLAFVADNNGLWALQSLVAERVDSGLLGAFTVVDVQP